MLTHASIFSVMLLIKLLLIFGIFLSHSIQFYVPMDVMEPRIVTMFKLLVKKLPPMFVIYEDTMQRAVQTIFRISIVIFTGNNS